MVDKFEHLEVTKRNKIINCGYEEYSLHGIKRASLNKILSNAGVSKGFFYHYFKDKDSFYNYLLEFGITLVIEKLNKESLLEERDYITRLQKAALYKNEVLKEFPMLMNFFTKYYSQSNKEDYEAISKKLGGDFSQRVLTENINYELFRDDISLENGMKIVSRYLSQVTLEVSTIFSTITFKETVDYYIKELEILRDVVYKKEN